MDCYFIGNNISKIRNRPLIGTTISNCVVLHRTMQANGELEILQEFPKLARTSNYLQPLL